MRFQQWIEVYLKLLVSQPAMRPIRRVCLTGALLLTALTSAAFAQGNSSLFGMVIYRGGEPATARIYVGREGSYRQITSKFRAGRNIGFRLEGILPGRYELLVTAPGGQPRRIWGVQVSSFEQKEVSVTLNRVTPEQELFCVEQGAPRMDDLPQNWQGGWLQGSLLNEQGNPVDGKIRLIRGTRIYRELVVGAPTLPAYYEERNVLPGLYDLEFEPAVSSGLKRVRIEKVTIAHRARTLLGTVQVPKLGAGDAVVILPMPERTVQPIR